MTLPRFLVTALLVAVLALLAVAAPPARAAGASQIYVTDSVGDEAAADVERLDIRWDGSVLELAFKYYPAPQTPAFTLRISPRGADELRTDDQACAPDPEALAIRGDGGVAQLTHAALGGAVAAAPKVEGGSVTYAFSSPALSALLASDARDPFACADGTAGGDAFYGVGFLRYVDLTRSVAKAGVLSGLEVRYGVEFPTATRKRVICPQNGIFPPRKGEKPTRAQIACTYSYAFDGRYRSGFAVMELRSGYPTIADSWSRVYPVSRKDCGRAALTTGRLRWSNGVPSRTWAHAWGRNVSCGTARKVATIVWRNRPTFYRCRFTKDTKNLLAGRCTRGRAVVWVEMGPDAF